MDTVTTRAWEFSQTITDYLKIIGWPARLLHWGVTIDSNILHPTLGVMSHIVAVSM